MTQRLIGKQRTLLGILGFALAVFVIALCFNPSPATDLFWQMRTGKLIDETHQFPYHDTYSWSRYGTPWIVHEWGMCVLLWKLFAAGGYPAVWIFEVAALLATFIALYVILLRETAGAPVIAFLMSLWAAWTVSPLISPRPHLITYLALTILVGVVLRVRRGSAHVRHLYWAPVICVVWANFHAGVIAGAAILAAFGICDFVEGKYFSGDDAEKKDRYIGVARAELIAAAACFLVMMANPYGVRIFEIFRSTVGDQTMPEFVKEWQAVDLHSASGHSLVFLIAICALGLAFSRRKREVAEVAIFVALAYAALNTNRNVPLFALVAIPLTARHILSSLERLIEIMSPSASVNNSLFGRTPPLFLSSLLAATVAVFSLLVCYKNIQSAAQPKRPLLETITHQAFYLDYFPESACRFMEMEQFPTSGKLYNAYNIGSYLEWRIPQYPVFISTQTDVYFGKVLSDYASMSALPYGWPQKLDEYHPDYVLTSADAIQARLFMSAPDWSLVYADRPDVDVDNGKLNALIFVRKQPKFEPLIARCRMHCPAAVAITAKLDAAR
ncbi:MAG: hypothetical protein ABIY70_20450 [Capsulimonas sp.]|uniref:hypothetical protein n=1 Tax=Capsulimonas sp. TaxID=2494211 RepID=UPI0032636A56